MNGVQSGLMAIALALGLCAQSSVAAVYEPGYVWRRGDATWDTSDNLPLSTVGQPERDTRQSPVWGYEFTTSGGTNLAGTSPWYRQPRTKMVWDPAWWSWPAPADVWAAADNTTGMISRWGMTFNGDDRVPFVRWVNPMTQSTDVMISGMMRVLWNDGYSNAVEAAVIVQRADGSISPVQTFRLDRPLSSGPAYQSATMQLVAPIVRVNPGDSLLVGGRGDGGGRGWLDLQDTAMAIRLMPDNTPRPYAAGFQWHRRSAWNTADNVVGTSSGQPERDANGNPVWSYRRTTSAGHGIGGAQPWYAQSTVPLVWDNSWFGHGGIWAAGDNVQPPVAQYSLIHNLGTAWFAGVPLVQWENPTNANVEMTITGTLHLAWDKYPNTPLAQVPVDVALVRFDAASGTYVPLLANTYTPPAAVAQQMADYRQIYVDLRNVWFGPNDRLLVTLRGSGTNPHDAWVSLVDDLLLTATAVVPIPEPASVGVVGVLLLTARRGARHNQR